MKVRIIGDAPVAALLTGLLASEKQEVTWVPQLSGDQRIKALKGNREIRLHLPWGWIHSREFRLSASTRLEAAELGVLAVRSLPSPRAGSPAATLGGANRLLLVLDLDPALQDPWIDGRTRVVQAVSLMEAVEWDPGNVEVGGSGIRLFLEAEPRLRDLIRLLKGGRIAVREVSNLAPCRHALQLRSLLSLPVALCHSTLGNFLAYPEGREIACSLLEEGLRLYEHHGLEVGRLPETDPRELLQRLRKKPREFDGARTLPDRAFGRALHLLLQGDHRAAKAPNERIVGMAAQTGFDPRWNWAVTQSMGRALRVRFYRDPVELYGALAR